MKLSFKNEAKKMYLATPNFNYMDHETMREKNNRRLGWAAALMGFIFGTLITFVGIAVFKADHFGIKGLQKLMADKDDLLMQIFGVVCIIYGLFRLYRAYDKIKNG